MQVLSIAVWVVILILQNTKKNYTSVCLQFIGQEHPLLTNTSRQMTLF